MPIAANQSFIGIAKEVTPGTAVAATNFLPVTAIKPAIKVMYLPDTGMRGSNAKTYDERPGVQYATFDFDGEVYPDTIGFVLTGLLGDVATTGASAPYSHAITLGNAAQPPTYTISDYNGFNTRQYAFTKFSEVGLKFAGDGLLDYSAKATCATFATGSKPTASFSPVQAVPNWTCVASIAGSQSSLVVVGDLTAKRTVEVIHNVDGTVAPYSVFAGGDFEVSGSFTAVYEDDTIFSNYLTGVQTALDFTWSQGSGASAVSAKLHMTTAQITDATVVRAGGKYVELQCKFEAIANTTDKGASGGYSPLAVTLTNALPAATYK